MISIKEVKECLFSLLIFIDNYTHYLSINITYIERGGKYVVYSRTNGVVPLISMTIDYTIIINYYIVIFLSLYFLIYELNYYKLNYNR